MTGLGVGKGGHHPHLLPLPREAGSDPLLSRLCVAWGW